MMESPPAHPAARAPRSLVQGASGQRRYAGHHSHRHRTAIPVPTIPTARSTLSSHSRQVALTGNPRGPAPAGRDVVAHPCAEASSPAPQQVPQRPERPGSFLQQLAPSLADSGLSAPFSRVLTVERWGVRIRTGVYFTQAGWRSYPGRVCAAKGVGCARSGHGRAAFIPVRLRRCRSLPELPTEEAGTGVNVDRRILAAVGQKYSRACSRESCRSR